MYYLTPIHAHTHTHRARASGRETSPVALSFFDGSFPLPSLSLLRFSTAPPKNTTQSFLFFSFHFASRSEPSLTLKLTHPENVKSVFRFSGFVSLLFLLSFFFFFGNKFNDFLKPKFLYCVVSVSVLSRGASHFFWFFFAVFGFLLLFSFFFIRSFSLPEFIAQQKAAATLQ